MICPNCEVGTILPRCVSGRFELVKYPNVIVEVPAELELPTCGHCLDYSVPEAMEEVLSASLQEQATIWEEHDRQQSAQHVLFQELGCYSVLSDGFLDALSDALWPDRLERPIIDDSDKWKGKLND